MFRRINRFITPDRGSSIWIRLMPYATLAFAGLVAFILAGAGWEYTNRSEFCGTACHTMPPEYASYLESPHANVNCVECHIGRATIAFPSRNLCTSPATSFADPYRLEGSFSRHFRQIVSKSRGTLLANFLGLGASSLIT